MEWHAFVISVILLLVVSDSNARSIEQVCTRSCETNDVRKFFAKNDFEYIYNYETLVESSFHAAAPDGDRARLNINADFSIITSTDCNLVLQVNRGVRFDNRRPETQGELDWQRAVTAHPLYFQWENGIVKQVCPSEDDPVWVVNFKRGILSAMQSSADETTTGVKEVDVSGTCESDYLVQEQSHSNVVIRKTKDYSTCENRNEHLLFSWSMPYEIDSLRQNYIQSHQRCVQTARDVLMSVQCNEEHTFRPFSSDDAGAKTTITQSITFTSQRYLRSYEAEEFPMRKVTLEYETEAKTSSLSMHEKTTDAKEVLTDICTNMNGESYDHVSKQFMSLVSAVRELDAASLVELSNHARTCTEYSSSLSQMLENTLPFCGTEGCVTFASTLIMRGELEDDLAKRWLAGFGFIKQPTIGMIRSILEIVENNRFPQQSFLSVGSMIQQFCENSNGDCMDNSEIRTTIEVLMQHLGTNCRTTNLENRVTTLLALRAIGNAGRTTSVPTLKRCIAESMNSLEVRIAALDSFRRMSCGTDRSGLLSILENTMEDSELRIAAYRNLMQCPTDQLLVKIKSLLEAEENMQVGSYIWSHLHEIKESKDPLKIFFSKMLEPMSFKEFDLDFRKYSRYYEATVFSEKFNSGGSADASVVWSPKSFIPRSVSTNVTIHMFGQAINLFELGGRLEGAEDYLQSILEPSNYEKRKASREMISSDSRHRKNARETPSNKVHLSAFARVFGKEFTYYNNELMASQESESTDVWSDMISKFMSTDGYHYHDDTLLLDSAHTLPTGIGMPLYMSFKGSSSLDVGAKGRVEMGGLPTLKYSVNGKFTPRAAITVSGSMIIDSHARKTGIATESVAYTSTSISGSVSLKNGGQNFDIELESPFDRNMALNFNHKLLKVVGEHTERMSIHDAADTKVCSDEYVGHRLCYTNTFHDNGDAATGYIFPQSGEIEISTYAEKMDATLTKYTASVAKNTFYENDDDVIPSSVLLQIDFDTPGSTVNRKAMVMASYNIPEKQISMIINKGDQISRLQGYYIATDDSKVLDISADLNGDIYSFKTDLQRMNSDEQKQATAGMVIVMPQKEMSADASLVYRTGESMTASFEMTNVLPTPVLFKVDLKDMTGSANKMTFSGDIEMKLQPFINSKLLVDMEINPDWNNIGFSVNYKIGQSPKESLTFYHKRSQTERQGESQYSIDHLLSSSQFATLNYKVTLNHGFSQGAISSTLDVAFGQRMLEKTNPYQAHFKQEFSDNSNATTTAKSGQVVCDMPFLNINSELKASYASSDRVLSMSVEGKSGEATPYAKFVWGSNGPETQLIQQDVEFEVYAATIGKWTMTSNLDESPKDIYSVKSSLSLGTTDELQFVQSAVITNLPTEKTVTFELGKGGADNGILQISSENIAKEGPSYQSKNLIQISGYESRGLNMYMSTLPKGKSASIEFLKAGIVSVGAVYGVSTTEHGRHYSMAVTQHDVHQQTIALNYGYEYVFSKLLESYMKLSKDESAIFSSQVTLKTLDSGNKYGNVSMMAKEHSSIPFSTGLDIYTSISATNSDGYSVDVIHHNNNKKINFHVENVESGVQGSLEQTYLTELDPLSFSAMLTDTGAIVKLMDNVDHESKLELSIEDSIMTATWANTMPMMNEYSPRNAKVVYKSLNDGFKLDTNSEKKNFDIVYRNRWPKLNHFELTNTLISTIIPETISWRASHKRSVVSVDAKLGTTTLDLNVNHASSDEFGLTFHHNSIVLSSLLPTALEISHVKEDENSQTQSMLITLGDKTVQFESSMTPAKHMISFGSSGIEALPESATIELEGNYADDEFNFVSNIIYDGTPTKLTVSGLKRFSAQSTNFPLVSQTGQGQLRLELLKNEEIILGATSTVTITPEELKHNFTFNQDVVEFLPHKIGQEQQVIVNDREYALVQKSINDAANTGINMRYSPQRLYMLQNMFESIPQELVATYEFGIEQGNFKILSGEENLASVEYSLSESSFAVTAKHSVESVAEFLPTVMTVDGSYTGKATSVTYIWGTRTGLVKFTNGLPNSATLFAKDTSMPLSINVGYTLDGSEFEISSKFMLKENAFNLTVGSNFNQEERLMKGSVSTGLQWNDKKFTADAVVDVVSINEIIFSIAKECSQGSFLMERKLTWNAEDNMITAKVEGTPRSPFVLEVTASHNGLTSATVEMTHNQEWQSIPKHTTATMAVTSSESNHRIALDAVADGRTRTAEATLVYNFNETGLHIDAKALSEFEMINFQNAGITLDGSRVTGKLGGSLALQFNGKSSEDKVTIVWSDPKQFVYTFTQDFLDILPQNGGLRLEEIDGGYKLEISRDDMTIVSKLLLSTEEVTASAKFTSSENHNSVSITLTKSPISLRMNQDLGLLSFMPRQLAVSTGFGENDNIVISVESDDQVSEAQIKKLKNGDLIEYNFHHNLPIVDIPSDISISYRITPPEVFLIWGETEAALQINDNGFTFRQNFVDTLPKSVAVVLQSEGEILSSMSQQIDIKVDEYVFVHELVFNRDVLSISITESLKQGKISLLDATINSRIATRSGEQTVSFEQTACQHMPSSFGYAIEYAIEESSGSVDLRYGIQDPIIIGATYNLEQENQIEVHLTHNIDEIVEMIPMSTTVQGNMLLNGPAMTYSTRFTAGDISKEISLIINNKIEQMLFDIAFVHDFEQLATYLPSFNASFDIMSNGKDLDASVFYKVESDDRYLTVHASIGENEYLVSVDQKLFEETTSIWRRRRHQNTIPDKYFFRVQKDDNTYKSEMLFRMGPKRRYLNVTASGPSSQSRKVWKLKTDHNLNKYLSTKLPTSSVMKFVSDENDYIVAFDIGNTEGRVQVTRDDPRYAVEFSQNVKSLLKAGVPKYMKMEVNNMQVTENSFHIESVFNYNDYRLSPTIDATLNNPSLSITGTQEGFDDIMSSEDFLLKVKSVLEGKSYQFTSSHNIDGLRAVGYPKNIAFNTLWRCGEKEGNIADTAVTLVIDQQELSNNLIIQMNTPTSIEINTNGVRPETFGSAKKINYAAEFSSSYVLAEKSSFSSQLSFEETDARDSTIRKEEVQFSASYGGKSVSLNVTVDIPSLLINHATVSGSLSWNDVIDMNAKWGLNQKETSVEMTLKTGDTVDLKIAKDDTKVNLLIDTNAEQQIVFGHNIEPLTMVPKSLIVAVDPVSYSLTVITEIKQIHLSFDLQPRSILVVYTVDGEEIVKVSGEYSTHPAYEVVSTVKISPLDVDVSSQSKIQFFNPSNGKSELTLSLMDNMSNKGFYANVYALLNDKGIWDTSAGILVQSNITDAEFKFDTTMVLHKTPFKCSFDIHYNDYSLVLSCTETSMLVSSTLPEDLPVHSFEYRVSWETSGSRVNQATSLSWNGEKKIGISETLIIHEDALGWEITYELDQPFFSPNSLVFNFNYGTEDGWMFVTAGVSEGNGRFFQVTEKWQSEHGTYNTITDVAQSYYDFGNFTTTGSVTLGTSNFGTEWRLTQLGTDVMTFTETASYANNEIEYTIKWKQPFIESIPSEYTESTNIVYATGSLDVSSEITHTGEWENIPQHLTTTGKITFSPMEYDNDWKIESDGKVVAFFKEGYTVSLENGVTAHLSWQHPFKQLFVPSLEYTFNGQLSEGTVKVDSELEYTGADGQVTITQEGTIIYAQNMFDYKITRNGNEIIFIDAAFSTTPYNMRGQFGWRQSICERMLANFNATVDIHMAEGSVTLTAEVSHSAEISVLPPQFTFTSHMTYTETSFALDEKLTLPSGQLVFSDELSVKKGKTGIDITVNTNSAKFKMDGHIVLDSGVDLVVTINHSYDWDYIPKSFVTTGKISYGTLMYDSDWTITSKGQELVTLQKKFMLTDDDLTVLLYWKQPYEDFVVTSLLVSSESKTDDNHVNSVNILKYNDVNAWNLTYDRVSDEHQRKYLCFYSENGNEYKYDSEFSVVGEHTRVVEEINLPEQFSLNYNVPSNVRMVMDKNTVDATTTLTTTVESSALENPYVATVEWTLHQDTVLFKGYIGLKKSSPDLPGMDAEVSLTVDTEDGITISYKVPQLGLDHQVTVRYVQSTSQITIEYVANHGRPIVFTINLGKILPTIRKVIETLQKKHVFPKMKPIAYYTNDENGFELVLGVRVRETPYTLHMNVGPDNEQPSFRIVTKRRNTIVDQVLLMTARIVDMENLQIEIEMNKGLDKYLANALGSSLAEMKDKVTVIADSLIEVLRSLDNFIEGSDMIQSAIDVRRNEMIERITNLKETILDFLTNMHTDSVSAFQGTEESSRSGLLMAVNVVQVGVNHLMEIVNKPWVDLKKSMLSQVSEQIYAEIEPMLQSVAAMLNKVHAGQLFLELVEEGVTKFVYGIDKNMVALLKAAEAPLSKFISVTDNKVVLTIPLSFKLKNTLAPPTWTDIQLWVTQSAFADEVRRNLKILDDAMRVYNRVKAILNMPFDEIFPPFKGHAEISGFRHIRTFDGKRYNYRSSCSSKHLLVHDTKYNDFSVYVLYEPVPVISIEIMDPSTGEQTINLNADYRVTDERNRNIIVPSEHNSVLVKRTGELISVKTNYGLVVTCNFKSELCTVDISAFYFDQVTGMLGTFNNEPSDDFTGKGNVIVRNSEELAQSWMDSQSRMCSGGNDIQRCDLASNEQCSFLFENERSPFAPCFTLEDPRPYQLMCSKDTCSRVSAENGVCRAYASYTRRCALQGVFLPSLSTCNKCDAVNGDAFNDDMEVPVTGTDVIFVVERATCLRFKKKDYKKMVSGVHSALRASSAGTSINFAVVGFGGPDGLSEPHTVTFGNQIFVETSSERLANDVERRIVNGLKVGPKSKSSSDILEGLSYASQMPLRAGAARTIILITCDECSAESELSLDTVRQQLVDQGIVLHHLRQKTIQAGRTAKKVYGFNEEGIFSRSTTLPRSELKVSSLDQCLPLTDLTSGSMWNSNIIGRDVWEMIGGEVRRGVEATPLQSCTCGATDFGTTTARCTDSRSRR